MSEPTFICSAPELANSAQRIALYSHYAAAVAGFAGCGVMAMRSRIQEKLPHILGAVAAFGIGITALYSQWEFNQYLYMHREMASNAVAMHAGLWFIWATLLLVGLAQTPGFRFKRMKRLALIPLIIFALGAFVSASIGDALAAGAMTGTPTADVASTATELEAWRLLQKGLALGAALLFGLPALVCALAMIVSYVISQAKKAEKRSMENHQARTGIMMMVAIGVPAIVYSAGTFLIATGPQGIDKAVLLFNCADVVAVFFMISATMSLLGVPANFPKPIKPVKPKVEESQSGADDGQAEHPTMLDQQQAYAQAYAQQLYAQQQAYAAYQQQQQTYAQQPTAQPGSDSPAVATPEVQTQQVAQSMPDLQQQQAQYYAQQQAYAAYQQQQQAYQQAYAQQQQQVYAQAYAQQQVGIQQQHNQVAPSGGIRPARVGTPRQVASPVSGGVKKVGGVRPIKKIR